MAYFLLLFSYFTSWNLSSVLCFKEEFMRINGTELLSEIMDRRTLGKDTKIFVI